MDYFVTGATGFIGRHLVPLLLQRGGTVTVLVRRQSHRRFADLRDGLGAAGERLVALDGDIAEPGLGIQAAQAGRLRGAGVFHLAAVYDLLADQTATERANVDGTRNLVAFANGIEAACLHHVSSIAVAGRFAGRFTEDMFAQGQALDHAYFRTKYEAERMVREQTTTPWRIYRPALVIGSSQTGEADRVDGPYYAFKLIQRLRDSFPQWMPFIGPEGGELNLVPVDFVARAIDHIAHLEGGDNQAFHLVDPGPLSLGDTLNTFCRAAHAPEFALRLDRRMGRLIPGTMLSAAAQMPTVQQVWRQILDGLGVPETALHYMDYPATFDATRAQAALAGSGIAVPPLHEYAWRVWDFWERHLDPELPSARNLRRVLEGRVVVITGASSGIGRAVCRALAHSGATLVGVARGRERLEAMGAEVQALGGAIHLRPTDLANPQACGELIEGVIAEFGGVDVLVNNAGRSIRRSVLASLDRFHDFERTMQLNYFGAIALMMAVVPGMRERGDGQIINVSSIGAQTYPPRFAAYVASKAALEAFTDCFAPEVRADGVALTVIHMPLVRTPMIEPTSIYRNFPTISADEAAEMVVSALIRRPHEVGTRLGKFGEVVNAVAPGLSKLIMTAAYAMLPDSTSSSSSHGEQGGGDAPVAAEAYMLGQLMRGVHL